MVRAHPNLRSWCACVAVMLLAPAAGRAEPCPPPLPATEPGFRHARALLVVEAGPANHRGQDVIAVAGGPQVLVAKMAYGVVDKDLKDEDVDVFAQRGGACAPWELLGTARTTREGDLPEERLGTWDDGGRVLLEVPDPQRLPVGRHAVRARVRGDGTAAAFSLWVVRPGTEVAIFDVDGTLTTGDDQLWKELAEAAEGERRPPAAQEAAQALAHAWVAKGVLPVYLTGRPDTLRGFTERWLRDQGFPPGVIRHADRLREAVPTDDSVGRFKVRALRGIAERATVRAAYGNAATDAFAYAEAGIPQARVHMAAGSWVQEVARVGKEPRARVTAPRPEGW